MRLWILLRRRSHGYDEKCPRDDIDGTLRLLASRERQNEGGPKSRRWPQVDDVGEDVEKDELLNGSSRLARSTATRINVFVRSPGTS